MIAALLVLEFLELTSPDGRSVHVNPNEIIAMHEPRPLELRTLSPKVHCVIFTADSKFVAVIEKCDEVRAMAHELSPE